MDFDKIVGFINEHFLTGNIVAEYLRKLLYNIVEITLANKELVQNNSASKREKCVVSLYSLRGVKALLMNSLQTKSVNKC